VRVLNVAHPTLDYLSLYVLASGEVPQVIQSGDRTPSYLRPYPGPSLALPFHLAAAQSAELYLRVQADAAAILVPIEIMSEDALRASMLSERVFHLPYAQYLICRTRLEEAGRLGTLRILG
jgi:hypothetical protein